MPRATLYASCVLAIAALGAALSAPRAAAGVIDPALESDLATLPGDAQVSVLISMAEQAPIAELDSQLRADRATRGVRHERVVSALKATAASTQSALLADLDARRGAGEVRGFTPYWIANLVVAQMSVSAVREVAARPDVGIVYANFGASLIEPPGGTPAASPEPGEPAMAATPGLRAINAHRVWYELGITGAGRLVGGLDTGVMGSHAALQARWRGAQAGVPWQHAWLDRLAGNTQFPVDSHGHGTHTMGTMVGLGAATQDTVGVAWGAEWIACNAINQGVGVEFDNDVIAAFQWFADPDGDPGTTSDVPDVVQNSWRINESFPGNYIDCDPRWWNVMDNCEAAGCAVVFSAGNEGPNPRTIGSPPDRITTPTNAYAIGAVDATNFPFPFPIASFSSRGPSGCDGATIKPEVVAPGVSVRSSTNNGGYGQAGWNGTSMAGPHVSGIFALMREANPDLDVTTMKQIIMDTARDLGPAGEDNSYGLGIPDAYVAVRNATCRGPIPLRSGASVPTAAPGGYYRFSQGQISQLDWSAVAVRDPDSDWDITVYQSATGGSGEICFSGALGISVGPGRADFVIGDFNHNALGSYYVYSFPASGQTGATTEWEGGGEIVVGDPPLQRTTGASDVIEVWDAFLTEGVEYDFFFERTGNANTKLFLFRSQGATYWAGRVSRVFETTDLHTIYTAPATDVYGVVVVNDDGGTGEYRLGISTGTTGAGTVAAGGAPQVSRLHAPVPNPTAGEVQIGFDLHAPGEVELDILDVHGRVIAVLPSRRFEAGTWTTGWNGAPRGGRLPAGVYWVRMEVSGHEVGRSRFTLLP